ncbi:hypothetical protein AZ34_06560 [Hylemonella gracilis str. Niagara R]|uniref:DUF2917 domain-containing protein n=1 Tax=Hylemonella gracilis str. Niagara R TaxID=1458275 RepID=A0A016XGR0_9BURK|nr:hypothetical protein [Hylemonella gracilis]EYC50762.1 hypothetical protein AZ34_06560 [Hylemonella gracilis str. Niagara R]
MTTSFPEFTALEPGQTLRVAVDAGAWVRVVEGKVQLLSPPAWLGETVFNASAELGAEDLHVVERGGWIEVVARSAARVQVLPAPVRSAHGARLGHWTQLLTDRLAVLRIR